MPKNEDGEFELILGNRQLLSVFFIVVVLLGVFFAMGYILGASNSHGSTSEASAKKADKPLVVESPTKDQTPAAQPAAQPETPPPAPEKTAAAPPPAKKEPEKKEPEKKEAPKEAAKATPPPKQELPKYKPIETKQAAASQPASGASYLQLVATTKDEADLMVDVLRKKGFKSLAAQIPEKKDMYRVLVGPLPDSVMNKTKTDLKNAGFPGDKAIKRTF